MMMDLFIGSRLRRFIHLVIPILCLSSAKLSSCADIGKYFTRTPQSIVAPPGDRVTFQCETNIPAEQVRWKLNGRFLHPANESDIRISGSFLVVKVSKVRERFVQQVGDYQCVVEFGAEALTSLPAQLTIAKLDNFQPHSNKTLEVVEGNAVAILCNSPYSNPSPVIQFYKDGRPLEAETSTSIVTDSGVLHLYNVSLTDSGNYWCTATNHITTETYPANWLTRLVVLQRSNAGRRPPEFLIKPKPYSVVPKDGNVTLECVAIGNPPPFTTWRKLRSSSMTNYRSVQGSLHLFNVDFAQEGEYICEAYNGVGDSLTTLSTVVLNSMPNITKEPASQVVEEGGEAALDCVTEGLPKPRMYWVFNGHTVHDDGNLQITEGGLKIARVEKKHAGLFQCFAANPMGTVTSPVEVKVLPKQITAMASDSTDIRRTQTSIQPPMTNKEDDQEHEHEHLGNHHKLTKFHRGKHKRRKHKGQEMTPPSKPVMNRVSDDSVMVRWTVPPNSGYPIQFFKIQYKEISKKSSRWMTIDDDIPPHIHSYEVRELKVSHAYRFRIAAVYSNNDNKVGPNSEKFVLQKEMAMRRPMYAPVITNAVPYNNTSVVLRWKHMKPETGGIDGYFIYYRESTSASEYSKVTVMGSDTESHYITFLKPGISYDMKIQSFNRAGASTFSSIVAAKTTGQASTEKPDMDLAKKEKDLIVPEDTPPPANDHLYLLLGCLFVGFWIFLCISCALCYKCKQKRAEEDAKYSCDVPLEVETKGLPNGHMNGHIHNGLNGYIPTITSHLDEKETSFVERFNNNRPISPSQLNSSNCDLSSFKTNCSGDTELKIMTLKIRKDSTIEAPLSNLNTLHVHSHSRNNSLQRKKHSHSHNNYLNNANGSLKRVPYVSCSSEDLDGDSEDTRGSRIFPKEHYKVSRKYNRKRSSVVE